MFNIISEIPFLSLSLKLAKQEFVCFMRVMNITTNHTLKKSLTTASKYFFFAIINELFQNPRAVPTPTQCNYFGEVSVCRCCCFSDECGKKENCTGKLYCLVCQFWKC